MNGVEKPHKKKNNNTAKHQNQSTTPPQKTHQMAWEESRVDGEQHRRVWERRNKEDKKKINKEEKLSEIDLRRK